MMQANKARKKLQNGVIAKQIQLMKESVRIHGRGQWEAATEQHTPTLSVIWSCSYAQQAAIFYTQAATNTQQLWVPLYGYPVFSAPIMQSASMPAMGCYTSTCCWSTQPTQESMFAPLKWCTHVAAAVQPPVSSVLCANPCHQDEDHDSVHQRGTRERERQMLYQDEK